MLFAWQCLALTPFIWMRPDRSLALENYQLIAIMDTPG